MAFHLTISLIYGIIITNVNLYWYIIVVAVNILIVIISLIFFKKKNGPN